MTVQRTPRQPSRLVLGWATTPDGEPRYWLQTGARPGAQGPADLVTVPAPNLACHTVIVAQSGSGKSAFLGRLLEELVLGTRAKAELPKDEETRVDEVEAAYLSKGELEDLGK